MFKKFLFAVAVVAGALGAQADFLWWQVSPSAGKTFTTAQLWVADSQSGNSQVVATQGPLVPSDFDSSKFTGTTVETVSTDISNYSASQYSFFVELVTYNSSGDKQGSSFWTNQATYDNLLSQGYITAPGVQTPFSGSGFDLGVGGSAIPEPTSGMLFLLGGALMALRRRRRA